MDLSALGLSTLPKASGADFAGAKLADDFDTFLTLLTTQLQNQDPLEPMKSEQFTEQLVQFSSVEQQIATNDNLETLTSLGLAGQQGALVNFIGKNIEGVGNQATLSDGLASWKYDLEDDAESVSILITNSAGKAVFTTKLNDVEAGANSFNWDGRDNADNELPDGDYRISIGAIDGDGTSVASTVRSSGLVEGVEIVNGVAQLRVGGNIVPVNQVTSVSTAPDPS